MNNRTIEVFCMIAGGTFFLMIPVFIAAAGYSKGYSDGIKLVYGMVERVEKRAVINGKGIRNNDIFIWKDPEMHYIMTGERLEVSR